MTHEEAIQKLDAYACGELPDPETRALRAHLADCPACRSELEWLRRLAEQAAALPRGIAPPRDLWAGIAGRLEPRSGRPAIPGPADGDQARARIRVIPLFRRGAPHPRRMLAAAAVLLVVASSAVTAWVVSGGTSAPVGMPAAGVALSPAPAHPRTALAAFAPAEAEYQRAADDLARILTTRREQLAPATVEVLERNLAIIDQAIRESRAALEADPNDAELARMLGSAYEAKVEVLSRAVSL